ncbi:MAG: DUF2007 domain-containing protein [Aquimonas sp.]|nr:DUF2007 domain-containing protein [Aquimonas sp.]
MHKVYEAENYIDAQIARGWLESAGVPVLFSGEHLGGAMGELPVFGLHSLWVAPEYLRAAESALAELAEHRSSQPLDDDSAADGILEA